MKAFLKRYRAVALASVASLLTGVLVAQGQVPGVNSTLQSVFTLTYDNSTMKPTYSATYVGALTALGTDFCTLTGSATKNVRVRRVIFSALSSTVQSDPIAVVKRSTANSGGTSVTMTAVPYDSTNSLTNSTSNAATAVARIYSVNPTLGTLVGLLSDPYYTFGNLTTGVGGGAFTFQFGALGSPVVLRGVAQVLAVNLNSQTFISGQGSCTFEWTEE